jgi:hypothetical protein
MNCTLSATRGKNTTNKLDKRLQRSTETVIRKAANCRGGDTIDSGGPAIHAVQASKTVFATSPCAPASNRRAAVPRPRIQLSPPLRLSLSLSPPRKKKSLRKSTSFQSLFSALAASATGVAVKATSPI